jgi:hypothetical protein
VAHDGNVFQQCDALLTNMDVLVGCVCMRILLVWRCCAYPLRHQTTGGFKQLPGS